MKKTLLAIFVALITALSCAVFVGCNIELGGETETHFSADNKEGTVELFEGFFEGTLNNTNQVATVKNNDKVLFTLTIDGTSAYAEYDTTGAKVYAFIKDGTKIFAMDDAVSGSKYYLADEDLYEINYRAYNNFLDVFDNVPDDYTFDCKIDGTGYASTDESKSYENLTMVITVTVEGQGSMVINATSKNGLVDKCTITSTDETASSEIEITFVYGNATVTVPDITEWVNGEFTEDEVITED